jgi:hypothetical protein
MFTILVICIWRRAPHPKISNDLDAHAQHIFFGCAIVNIIWSATLNWENMAQLTPSTNNIFRIWWEQSFCRLQGKERKIFSTIVILTAWTIWQERNGRVFRNELKTKHRIMEQMKTLRIELGRVEVSYALRPLMNKSVRLFWSA